MDMESKGFDPGNREIRQVYEERFKVFPQGSLIAYLGLECVGCIFAEIWDKKPAYAVDDFVLGHDIGGRHNAARGTELYVTSMTIDPKFRGQGLGAQLFQGCIAYVAERFPLVNSSILLVNETWAQARAIYRESGFVEVARFPGFFIPHEGVLQDGIVMRKKLR